MTRAEAEAKYQELLERKQRLKWEFDVLWQDMVDVDGEIISLYHKYKLWEPVEENKNGD